MPIVADALAALEAIAPAHTAFEWDKIGLQVGDPRSKLTRAVVALDSGLQAAEFTVSSGAELLLAHHPLIWEPVARIDPQSRPGDAISVLVASKVAFVAAHTNWDAASGGINDTLARLLDLADPVPFGSGADIATPMGRIGTLQPPLTLGDLALRCEERLDTRCTTWGDPSRRVQRLAVVGGAADDEWRAARQAGADALVTGEVRQHTALEASEAGFCLVQAGHFATEDPGCAALREAMARRVPQVEWLHFQPRRGESGRPV